MEKTLVILGGGGQASVIIEALSRDRYDKIYIEDQFINVGSIHGCEVISDSILLPEADFEFIVAIGDNFKRSVLVDTIYTRFKNPKFATIVHPTAYVAESAKIGAGSMICGGSFIGPNSVIGNHVIINTNSSIDHDCVIDSYSSTGPNSTLGGNAQIGKISAIAISATVSHGVKIGSSVIVGANSLVLHDIDSDNSVWVGSPAKEIRKRSCDDRYL